MAVLDTLRQVEQDLLGVVGDAEQAVEGAVEGTVKTAAEMIHDVIETLSGAVKD